MTRTPDDHLVPDDVKHDAELQAFAADPTKWGKPERVLTGPEATEYARSVLEAAGVDLDALARRRGRGRPRLGPGEKGTRSPRVAASISPELDARLNSMVTSTGKERSEIVREALQRYLPSAS
ncbi:ribbon-helix-helix protein, CopG family [Promicromonospora sukumoe]|uniref:ribbon-helix-helix protein, CopG family n=1 Tax=Promicromonospora sukumoe TaxID=88382 RepID=UPI0037C7C31B